MVGSISQLLELMRSFGAASVYAKKLSPNDNTKNQIYLGGDFSALQMIPHGKPITDSSDRAGSRRERIKADIKFFWIDGDGKYVAPYAQLISYPGYPEVRMSGTLKGCEKAPSDIMGVRDEGRVLFLGIARNGEIFGYAVDADHALARELRARDIQETVGVFVELAGYDDTKQNLLEELRRIHEKGWIESKRLRADGVAIPYQGRNGGGYTLEAELGIPPNSYAGPDFMGWEVKQYGAHNLTTCRPKGPITLMTPEPTNGLYKKAGLPAFLRKFGYPDKNNADRINFGGIYACNRGFHHVTKLRLVLEGYDKCTNKITDMTGGIMLISTTDDIAAVWRFTNIMEHWNKKHTRATYVPSISKRPPLQYSYGSNILVCEGTDFLRFLNAVAEGVVYYDPAHKMENASSPKPRIKKRSQFRINYNNLEKMYIQSGNFDLNLV